MLEKIKRICVIALGVLTAILGLLAAIFYAKSESEKAKNAKLEGEKVLDKQQKDIAVQKEKADNAEDEYKRVRDEWLKENDPKNNQ